MSCSNTSDSASLHSPIPLQSRLSGCAVRLPPSSVVITTTSNNIAFARVTPSYSGCNCNPGRLLPSPFWTRLQQTASSDSTSQQPQSASSHCRPGLAIAPLTTVAPARKKQQAHLEPGSILTGQHCFDSLASTCRHTVRTDPSSSAGRLQL